MKLSPVLSILLLLSVCSTALLGNNEEFEKFLKKQPDGAEGYKSDLKRLWNTGECSNCNLQGFDLREVIKKYVGKKIDLSRSDCRCANLSNVDMTGADLSYGRFDFATLENSTLKDADLSSAYFIHTNMFFAKMQNAKIQNAKFRHTCLWGANLYGAEANGRTAFRYANCRDTDFRNVKNIEWVNFKEAHLKNSKFNLTTLQKIHPYIPSISSIFGSFPKSKL